MFRYKQQKNGKGCYNMRIAICDDEKNVRKLIGKKVRKLYPKAELIFFESGEEILAFEDGISYFWIFRCREKMAWRLQESYEKKTKICFLFL